MTATAVTSANTTGLTKARIVAATYAWPTVFAAVAAYLVHTLFLQPPWAFAGWLTIALTVAAPILRITNPARTNGR